MSKTLYGSTATTVQNVQTQINSLVANSISQSNVTKIVNTTLASNNVVTSNNFPTSLNNTNLTGGSISVEKIKYYSNNNIWYSGASTINNGFYICPETNYLIQDVFFIGNNTNVGIGTNDPQYKLEVIGDTNIFGNMTITSNVFVGGAVTILGNINVSGTIAINNLFVTSNATIGGSLDVTGLSTLQNGFISNANSTINGSLLVTGNETITGTLFTTGLSTLQNGFISNANSTINSDLAVTGNETITGTLFTTGLSTLQNGFISNANSTINSDLAVTGNETISGTLFTTGLSTLQNGFISNANSTVNGNLTVTGTFFNPSDSRLKTNIVPLQNSLDIINELSGYSYNYIKNNEPSYGLIAQEVEKHMPYAIRDNEYKYLNYNAVIPFLVESIKELNKRIKILENNNG